MKTLLFLIVFGIAGLAIVIAIVAGTHHDSSLTSQPDQDLNQAIPHASPIASPIVYGYLPYWTRNTATISPLVTHISFFSLGIQADGKLLDLPQSSQETGYRVYKAGEIKKLHSQILASQKIELTLTMMDQEAIPVFLRSEEAQDRFLQDLEAIVTSEPLTGINIDIEYNGLVDEELQENLATLLHKTNALLKKQPTPLTLSIATYADAGNLQRVTHLKKIEPQVDYIIMMAYDYHRSKSLNAGPTSPLYGKMKGKWAEDIMNDLSQYTSIVPAHKIILGIPFYGYAWTVEDSNDPNSFTLPKTGESVPYANIKKLLLRPNVRKHWDTDAVSPYLQYSINGKTKILYYDDSQSLTYKLQLVRQAGLGGIAIWALGYEEKDTELWDTIRTNLLQ